MITHWWLSPLYSRETRLPFFFHDYKHYYPLNAINKQFKQSAVWCVHTITFISYHTFSLGLLHAHSMIWHRLSRLRLIDVDYITPFFLSSSSQLFLYSLDENISFFDVDTGGAQTALFFIYYIPVSSSCLMCRCICIVRVLVRRSLQCNLCFINFHIPNMNGASCNSMRQILASFHLERIVMV